MGSVGVVRYKPGWFRGEVDIAEELLREGLAVVYKQGNAQYDGKLKHYIELEKNAEKQRRGMWRQKNMELPSEYKKKMRLQGASSW